MDSQWQWPGGPQAHWPQWYQWGKWWSPGHGTSWTLQWRRKGCQWRWPPLLPCGQSAQSRWQWVSSHSRLLKPVRRSDRWWCGHPCWWPCQSLCLQLKWTFYSESPQLGEGHSLLICLSFVGFWDQLAHYIAKANIGSLGPAVSGFLLDKLCIKHGKRHKHRAWRAPKSSQIYLPDRWWNRSRCSLSPGGCCGWTHRSGAGAQTPQWEMSCRPRRNCEEVQYEVPCPLTQLRRELEGPQNDSQVAAWSSALTLALHPWANSSLMSAGIWSPPLISTMSPTTSCSAGMIFFSESRMTSACCKRKCDRHVRPAMMLTLFQLLLTQTQTAVRMAKDETRLWLGCEGPKNYFFLEEEVLVIFLDP